MVESKGSFEFVLVELLFPSGLDILGLFRIMIKHVDVVSDALEFARKDSSIWARIFRVEMGLLVLDWSQQHFCLFTTLSY